MADNKQKKNWKQLFDKHAETKGMTKLGDYKESTGGGTPMAKGQKIDYVADNVQEAESYRKEHPKATVRVQQPRDEDGQFTYNSANRRGLKYGPSRGKTIPPFLRDVELAFSIKSGQGSIIMGGKRYKPLVAFKTKSEFAKMFTEYSEKDDAFVGKLGMSFGAMTETAKGMGGKIGKTTTLKAGALISEIKAIAKAKGDDLKYDHVAFANPPKSTKAEPTQPMETKAKTNPFEEAKTNIEGFKAKNKAKIDDFYNFAEGYGYDEADLGDEFWQSVVDEGIESFEELKDVFKENFA